MKNILVVTDFSDASKNASRYAVELARHFGSKLFLFNAYQVPVQVPESYLIYNTEDVWEGVKTLLEKEKNMINPGDLVNIEICGAEGVPVHAILSEVISRKADLIICGMKGMAKALKKILGSTTSALIRKSDIPMIVVPEDASFRQPGKIALACDMDPETAAATVDMLKTIAGKFNAVLSVVWVVDEGVDGANEMRFHRSGFINELKNMNPVFEFPKGSNIIKTLEGFVKTKGMDILAMIPHKHDWIERLFTETITKNMLFHTDIPLLVLPQKKIKEKIDPVNDDQKKIQALDYIF